uniref:Uncharacterized protein n=1 Tax=Romanomermis culicivorax TaxID=13658 RepID=A0A915KML5_ROMCU
MASRWVIGYFRLSDHGQTFSWYSGRSPKFVQARLLLTELFASVVSEAFYVTAARIETNEMAAKMTSLTLIFSILVMICSALAKNDQEPVQSQSRARRHHGGSGHHGGFHHHGGHFHSGWRNGWGDPFWNSRFFGPGPFYPPPYFGGLPPVVPIGVGQPWVGPVPVGPGPMPVVPGPMPVGAGPINFLWYKHLTDKFKDKFSL